MSSTNISVIGDVMLDVYLKGDTSRVSPDAPVIVVNLTEKEYRLGGSANVANNLTSFGLTPRLFSVVGADQSRVELERLCSEAGVSHVFTVSDELRTTTKTRVLARNQHIVRIDEETRCSASESTSFFDSVRAQVLTCDGLIISDYNKGVVGCIEEIISFCRQNDILTFIDPKDDKSFEKYAGATILKPNLKEFEQVYGSCRDDDDLYVKMVRAIDELSLEYMLVTLGRRGMVLVDRVGSSYRSQQHGFEVIDVTGCGDTVLASVAYFFMVGETLQRIIDLSNDMAGVVARKAGTSIVTADDIAEYPHLAEYVG